MSSDRRVRAPLSLCLPFVFGIACGSSGDPAKAPPDAAPTPLPAGSLQGTAAVGAPIVGAQVAVACAMPVAATVTTNAAGGYGLDAPAAAFPCAVKLSGGTVRGQANAQTLFSFAAAPGIANVTPLTDATLALALAAAPATALGGWFAGTPPAALPTLAAAVTAAEARLKASLTSAGYPVPAGSFLSTSFAAAPGDATDDLLEAFARGLAAQNKTHADLVALLAANPMSPTLPAAPAPAPRDAGAARDGGGAPADASAAVSPSPSGPLGAGAGIHGTLGGAAYTHTANVAWTVLGQTGSIGAFKPNGATWDATNRWELRNVPPRVGTHACSKGGLAVLLLVDGALLSTDPTGGACSVAITSVDPVTIEGTFTATLVDLNGKVVGSVTDGLVRKPHPDVVSQHLGATEAGMTVEFGGKIHRFPMAVSQAYETFAGVSASSMATPVGVQLHTLPNAKGTYPCGHGMAYRNLNIWFLWLGKYYHAGARSSATPNGPAGSSCSVTIANVGALEGGGYKGTLDGSWSGTLVTPDGSSKIEVTKAQFRLIAP
jgi:hypothetical protein